MTESSRYQKILFLSLGFFLLLVMMAVFHENGILNAVNLEQSQRKAIHENVALKNQNEKLRQEIQDLKSNPYAIERIAREKLKLIKPGDQVYNIVQTQKLLPPPK